MIILLSPSKTLDVASPFPAVEATTPLFLKDSAILIRALRAKSTAELGKLMAVSDKIATLNHERFQCWHMPFTLENSRPCFYTFKGGVYEGLDAGNFDAASRIRAQESLRILSGLYGVLRPFDLIQPYRLEMGIKLETERGKNLYSFWGDKITDALNDSISADQLVINLASEEYFSAVNNQKLKGKLLTPVFKEKKGKQLKTIGLFAKKARGKMARYLLTQNNSSVEKIKHFAEDGYCYASELSNEQEMVFIR